MATKQEILTGLSEEQRDVVTHYNGKISLEAIPGSGKTSTIVHTIAYMIKDGVAPSRILAFTFTKKAAGELKERVQKTVGPDADKVTICTYHSFCGRLLRSCSSYIGRGSNFTIYDEDDKKKVLGEIVKEYFKGIGVEAMKYNMVANYISNYKMMNLSPEEAMVQRAPKSSYDKAACFIYASYANKMRELNACDYDDLPYYAYRVVKTYPEVLDYVSRKYDYVISDENQDSNRTNLDFIMLLGSRSQNIMMVGDTDQSIYAFRGADVQNVISTIESQGFKTKFLSTNYRSTETIVKAADSVIRHNSCRIDKISDTVNAKGENIDLVYTDNCFKEADYICRKIKILMEKAPDLDYKDFAILCRTTGQVDRLEEAFLKHHIPFTCKGKVPFYARAEIKDILAYIKFSLNEKDTVALERSISVPKRGIGASAIENIILELSEKQFCDIITTGSNLKKLNKKAKESFDNFKELVTKIQDKILHKMSPDEILTFIVEETGYIGYLEDSCKEPETLDRKKLNVKELVYLAATYDSLEEFMQDAIMDEPNIDNAENVDNKVSIMTMHSSKGLEFPVVILAGLHDEAVPHIMSHDSDFNIQEERRLFYVSMTRAENKLIMTCPRTVSANGKSKAVPQSRFLAEIPSQYLNKYKY